MVGESLLLQLIDLVYDAAVNPDGWTLFLQSLSDAFHGQTAALFTQDFQTSIVPFAIAVRSDPDFVRSYQDHFASMNIWTKREEKMPAGRGVTEQMLASDAELLRSEFYNDWLRPQSLHHALGGVILRQGDLVSKISVLRSTAAGPYTEEDLAAYRVIVGHLGRALEMQNRIGNALGAKRAAEDALDRVPSGVIMLDASGGVIYANQTAASICAACDGLSITRGGLRATRQSEDARLQRLIGNAVATSVDGGLGAGVLAIARSSAKSPYGLVVSPVSRTIGRIALRQPAALVFISDPERTAPVPQAVLRDLYGLTGAEARLLAALLQGDRLQDYAERQSVTMNTARTQLAHIFGKTGTSRQAELIRMCLCDPVLQIAAGEASPLRAPFVSRKK